MRRSWCVRTDTASGDLLTLDERHFQTLRGAGGRPFFVSFPPIRHE
jgi:hypothetical protein